MRWRGLIVICATLWLADCGERAAPPTPPIQRHTADVILNGLRDQGFAIDNVRDKPAQAGGTGPPNTTEEHKSFDICTVPPPPLPMPTPAATCLTGELLVFTEVGDLQAYQQWYQASAASTPFAYPKGNVLLVLPHAVPELE